MRPWTPGAPWSAAATSSPGIPLDKAPATSSTDKWRYWRAALSDGSRVSLDIYQKAPGKASMGISHTKLDSAESVEHWRAFWRGLFKEL